VQDETEGQVNATEETGISI